MRGEKGSERGGGEGWGGGGEVVGGWGEMEGVGKERKMGQMVKGKEKRGGEEWKER